MGANAQTTVQKFVDGAVLTAAQQNTSAATGVPVFATTVTRDAAFGGANKVLAEGQTCYLESTNVVQYYDGAAWATVGPALANVVSAIKVDAFSSSSGSFTDITGLSVTITPIATSSKILVTFNLTVSAASDMVAMFNLVRNSTNLAQSTFATNNASAAVRIEFSSDLLSVALTFLDSPATTSATTYKIQCRTLSPTIHINRTAANTTYGGVSTITVSEVLA